MRLNDQQVAAAEAALTGPGGGQLIDLMRCVSLCTSHAHIEPAAKVTARQLGWLTEADHETPLGHKVCDPLREYAMWNERGRQTHAWQSVPFLHPATFEGKRVVELGSGFGSNLFSLQAYASEVIGVELEPSYIQFTPILAALADTAPPRIIECGADNVPLSDGYADVIVSMGSLQYMPFKRTLQETSRLLRPGGEALFALSHLTGYLRHTLANFRPLLSPRPLLREVVTVTGMVLYPWLDRAFLRSHDGVYPTHRRMERWVNDAGMRLDWSRTVVRGHETNFVVVKDYA